MTFAAALSKKHETTVSSFIKRPVTPVSQKPTFNVEMLMRPQGNEIHLEILTGTESDENYLLKRGFQWHIGTKRFSSPDTNDARTALRDLGCDVDPKPEPVVTSVVTKALESLSDRTGVPRTAIDDLFGDTDWASPVVEKPAGVAVIDNRTEYQIKVDELCSTLKMHPADLCKAAVEALHTQTFAGGEKN